MRHGTKSPEIPVLSSALLTLADICARELWSGKNFMTGKPQQYSARRGSNTTTQISPIPLSDERLLEMFALPFYSHAKAHSISPKVNLLVSQIDPCFIHIAGLNGTRKPTEDGIKAGIKYLLTTIAGDYKGYITDKSKQNSLTKASDYTSQLVDAFGDKGDINHRALAFRILFFAIPDFPCFNYSVDILKALKLKPTESNFFMKYVEIMDRGYELNWERLCQFEMPLPNHLDSKAWLRARNHGWWQRRIYDLALLFHFGYNENKPLQPYSRAMGLFHTKSLPYA